jgi:hypothetical protein
MRRGLGVIAAVVAVLSAAVPARAQDAEVRYWPLREINFPVPLDTIQAMKPRPTKLRFYVARDRGKFDREAERALTDLDLIDPERNRRGFRYVSPADGEYAFAVQLVYPDGDVKPRDSELVASYRVIIDTRPPVVRAAPVGATGVEWEVTDDNPKPDAVELQVRWVGERQFTTVTPRAFGLRDRYTWSGLNASQPLEVRIVARDRAGHEGMSRPITLPATGAAAGAGLDRGDPIRPTSERGGAGFGHPEDFPTRPQIDYVNSRNLTIESKLTRVTRSGVRAAHLWVNDGKSGWKLAKSEPVTITPADRDPTVRIPYPVEKDGLYGFIVIPENGAGGKQDDPRPGDPAQFLIEVDTERPFVKVKNVKVSPGGSVGPRVEIEWEAVDKNLFDEPIVLEYSTDKAGGRWEPITAGKVRNSGRYVWEVEDKNLWRIYVRASAVDKASNRSEHVYEKEVLIDLEKPAAVIEKVQGSGGSPPERDSRKAPEPEPVSPSPAPVAPSSPAPGAPTSPLPPPSLPDLPKG